MAPAGRLMLKMLPWLAPLLASGMHLGGSGSGGRGGGRLSVAATHALHVEGTAAGKRVLLIVAGLVWHFEETWPQMVSALILPNELAGYSFTNFFVTNTGLGCHEESPKWTSRNCEEPTDKESNVNQIKKLFAPRQVTVLDHVGITAAASPYRPQDDGDVQMGARMDGCQGGPEDDGDEDAIVRAQDGSHANVDDTDNACSGWTWWDRVHHVLERVVQDGQGARFDRMVALRPDVVVKWAQIDGVTPNKNPVELRLEEMCHKRPGFSFVKDLSAQSRHGLHAHPVPGRQAPSVRGGDAHARQEM